MIFLVILLALFGPKILGFIDLSSLAGGLGSGLETNNADFTASFAATELGYWTETMWILPTETVVLLLGSGIRARSQSRL